MTVEVAEELRRGREAYADRAWAAAYDALSGAEPLGGDDLELLATCAHMLGRQEEWIALLERAHHAHLRDGETLPAVRCAYWVATNAAIGGRTGRASAWRARAERLMEGVEGDCVERGYLLVPVMLGHEAAGELEAAASVAARIEELARRFGEADLLGLALQRHGRILIDQGHVDAGLALLDEAMLAVVGGELSPVPTGIVYCSVIVTCRRVFERRRAQEWTGALARWCEDQPDLVAYSGQCLVHRAELAALRGEWPTALAEARRAGERSAAAGDTPSVGEACYHQGEVHRLRGEPAEAEEAYRQASWHGREPQPGLALLRLAQGRGDAAAAAIRRAAGETAEPLARAALLPALAEIALHNGDMGAARAAAEELDAIAGRYGRDALRAAAAQARGAVALASGDPNGALAALRDAGRLWQALEAPYERARTRALIGSACRALGDEDAARLELDAARAGLEQLGAAGGLARLDTPAAPAHGLTRRELEVLRRVAAGETNRAIASALVLSERTVDRHVSNILAKLRVSSRAAATAHAYEHGLL